MGNILTAAPVPQVVSDPIELLTRFKNRSIVAGDALQNAYEHWKGQQNVLTRSGLTRADMARRVERYQQCADLVELRESNGTRRLHTANFCKNPTICPICSRRVASRRRSQWFAPIREAAEMFPFAYLVTFTVRSGTDLGERYDTLKGAIRRFRRMGQRRKNGEYSPGEWRKVRAAVVSDEVVRGQNTGLWHAHAHAVLFCDEALDYRIYENEESRKAKTPRFTIEYQGKQVPASKLSSDWFEATAGEGFNVHVCPIEHVPANKRTGPRAWSPARIAELEKLSYADSVAVQCCEVLKYATKVSSLKGRDVLSVLDVLYNRRTVSANGRFHNLPRYQCTSCGRSVSGLVAGPGDVCPDCGGTMLRDNSDEYRENDNAKTDKIFSVRWMEGEYSRPVFVERPVFVDPDGIDFPDVKHRYSAQSAVMVGRYRTKRRKLLDRLTGDRGPRAESMLDALHDELRDVLRRLWDSYAEVVKDLFPMTRGKVPGSDGVQPSWSPTGKIIQLTCWDCGASLTNHSARGSTVCPHCSGVLVHISEFLPADSTS